MLAWQAPPRRFFAWWCGGMTVQDLLVLMFVLAINLWYFITYYQRYAKRLDAGGQRRCCQASTALAACAACVCMQPDATADPPDSRSEHSSPTHLQAQFIPTLAASAVAETGLAFPEPRWRLMLERCAPLCLVLPLPLLAFSRAQPACLFYHAHADEARLQVPETLHAALARPSALF